MVTNLASVGSGVVKMGAGVLKMGAGVLKMGARVVKMGEAVVKMGAEVVKVGVGVPSVNILLKTDNNRVMSLYFGTFNIHLAVYHYNGTPKHNKLGNDKTTDIKDMIQVNNINFAYPGTKHKVFEHFSLQLKENNIYGLLGKNGTGKSTLLYLICGMLRPSEGEVLVDGSNSCLHHPEMLSNMFIVPEEYDLPHIRLSHYVKVNRGFYPNFSQEVLDQCLAEFELNGDPNLGQLSMGQKKKVYMSFALATGTRLLLMDEPTNGLDIPSKSLFRRVIARHMTPDRTLIISTHQVHDVESLLDHVVILDHSEVLLDASISDICQHYRFEQRPTNADDSDVVYAEPNLQGCAVIAHREEGMAETPVDLELLFDGAINHKLFI